MHFSNIDGCQSHLAHCQTSNFKIGTLATSEISDICGEDGEPERVVPRPISAPLSEIVPMDPLDGVLIDENTAVNNN